MLTCTLLLLPCKDFRMTSLQGQALLADGAGGLLGQPLVQAGLVELVLAPHLAQARPCLQIFQANEAPAAFRHTQRPIPSDVHNYQTFSFLAAQCSHLNEGHNPKWDNMQELRHSVEGHCHTPPSPPPQKTHAVQQNVVV